MARKLMDLKDRGYLVTLISKIPKSRKLDPKAAKAVDEKLGSKRAGNFNKILLTAEFMAPATKHLAEFRKEHAHMTIPYMKPWAILNVDLTTEYRAKREAAQDAFYKGVDQIYPDLGNEIEKARIRLGPEMFNEMDFPTKENFKKMFVFTHDSRAIESANDLRAHLAEDEIVAVENNIHRRYRKAVDSVYVRVEDAVGRLAVSLAKYDKDPTTGKVSHGFHKTAVQDLRNLVAILPSLNLMDDSKLDDLAKRIDAELTRYEVPELKENDTVRENVLNSAENILNVVEGYRG